MNPITMAALCGVLILGRVLVELALEQINQRHVRARARQGPDAFAEATMDRETYSRSVAYTLARSRLSQAEAIYDAIVLAAVLFSGVLPWGYAAVTRALGTSLGAQAAYFLAVVWALSVVRLPLAWYAQFHLEERFGFNTATPGLWWTDRLKGWGLSALIGGPVLLLVLYLVAVMGWAWWLWAWGCVIAVQLVLWVVAPIWILPLFNKLTPLAEDQGRARLLALAERAGFRARNVQVMDGSKRSRHSNAFFTGFGRFRKIVLYDTLLQQLELGELESVLAHEIGHYRLRHLQKMFVASALGTLVGFYVLAQLAGAGWFYQAFGFAPGPFAVALLLFVLLSGLATFWLAPVANRFSRRYEYQADAFARRLVGEPRPLIAALRKLAAKNLSNLTPHPLYSGFYYSHPTLREREAALGA